MTAQGLYGRVLATLGPEIASGEHASGTVLRIEALEERFGVSRTVIREAVRVLESMRLVVSRRRVGVTVRPKTEWNLYDPLVIRWRLAGPDRPNQLRSLTELRLAVEPVAAAFAAQRATPDQCGELTGLAIQLAATARARDLEAFLGHDIAFHRLVLEASGNEMYARLADVVAEVLAGRTHHHLMPAEPAPTAVRLHAQVAEAVQCGDARRAEECMREIVTGAGAEMRALLE
ncbi:FadR/GntR family transcriptional regulator [Gandjariella thermophila]|uniref:Transcriptional regulator n=1 Tax=Gandjariella thermophila TaxID=1931992 RepID=A0A4D4JEM0_9PSEU|nr:FCD domain-containing protein [Gandjariella thermophila]GDY33108.1 transcriptional regulator [Gandjariella thermophila]